MINPDQNHFLSYDLLEIYPHEVFRSKREQKLAVYELCKGLSNLVGEKHPSAFEFICKKFEELCRNLRKK